MNNTLHTPAPWGFKPVETCNDNPCRWEILGGVGVIAETNDHTTDANARLIASAPDLLDALDWALRQIEDDLDPDHQAAFDAAFATLRKAKGEA
jgi:hypothetical protein